MERFYFIWYTASFTSEGISSVGHFSTSKTVLRGISIALLIYD